MYEDVVGELK